MEYVIQQQARSVKSQLKDILISISWRSIAKDYFGKSSSWIYQRLDGIDGNGKPTDFSAEEKETLRGALLDLSERLKRSAEAIK